MEVHWLCLQRAPSRRGPLRLSLTLIAPLSLSHHRGGARWDIRTSGGSKGLSSGGLQPKSCWRGHYVRKTTISRSHSKWDPWRSCSLPWKSRFLSILDVDFMFFPYRRMIFSASHNHSSFPKQESVALPSSPIYIIYIIYIYIYILTLLIEN